MANLTRYVTKYDGSQESIDRIRRVLTALNYDNRYSFEIDSDFALVIRTLAGQEMVVPLGYQIVIPQEGKIHVVKD